MGKWFQRMGALFGNGASGAVIESARSRPPLAVVLPPAQPLPHLAPGAAPTESPDVRLPFFEWLLDLGPALDTSLHDSERQLLARLDAVLASDTSRTSLLPRAPAVIPQLLNGLRDERQSAHELAQRVMRDPHLVATVLGWGLATVLLIS